MICKEGGGRAEHHTSRYVVSASEGPLGCGHALPREMTTHSLPHLGKHVQYCAKHTGPAGYLSTIYFLCGRAS